MKVEYGWHFLPQDRQMRYGNADGVLGTWDLRSVDGELSLCAFGLHWSPRIIDALQFAPGAIACRVACWGDTIHGDDKAVSRHRQILWWVDAERVLWSWLCDIADAACAARGVTNDHSLGAIRLRREWLAGRDVTANEWAAASDAAWAAASDAARAAASDAARAAARAAARDAARDAAWAAASDAAWAAASDAARAAARAAARDAAWDAARDAAWDAARAAQNESLEAAIRTEAKRLGCYGWDQ